MHDLGNYLGIHPLGALATVIATVLLYVVFVWVLRSWGQRLLASPSSLDLAVVSVIGALVGRATMGRNPTLAGGVIALATLLVCQYAASRMRGPVAGERAVALMVAGESDRDLLARYGIDDRSLWTALRSAGISRLDDVALVVLESNGQFSVLRSDTPVHESALSGVRDAEDVHARLRRAGLALPRGGDESRPG